MSRRKIAILPFESTDYSSFRESLSAAALIHELEPIFVSDFYLTCDVSNPEQARKQRDGELLLALAGAQLSEFEEENRLIVTSQDIFSDHKEYVLGKSGKSVALISTNRLVRWEEGITPSRIQERILKDAAHEIGHLVGLPDCTFRKSCIMSHSSSVLELDEKLPLLCASCLNRRENNLRINI